MIAEQMQPNDRKWDVCVTSYEMAIKNASALKKFNFDHIIVDEAHRYVTTRVTRITRITLITLITLIILLTLIMFRLKNEASTLSRVMRDFTSDHRLLITGEPTPKTGYL